MPAKVHVTLDRSPWDNQIRVTLRINGRDVVGAIVSARVPLAEPIPIDSLGILSVLFACCVSRAIFCKKFSVISLPNHSRDLLRETSPLD